MIYSDLAQIQKKKNKLRLKTPFFLCDRCCFTAATSTSTSTATVTTITTATATTTTNATTTTQWYKWSP